MRIFAVKTNQPRPFPPTSSQSRGTAASARSPRRHLSCVTVFSQFGACSKTWARSSLQSPDWQSFTSPFMGCLWRGKMECKRCGSEDKQEFPGELSVNFSGIENINQSPVYVCQSIFVCLVCGHTELMVPAAELKRLRKGAAVFVS